MYGNKKNQSLNRLVLLRRDEKKTYSIGYGSDKIKYNRENDADIFN